MDTKKLRQKILDLAIHGKLVPQDPNDEPASVLLERIRAEKEALIKEGKIKRTKKTTASDTSHYENVPFEVPEGWCWCRLDDLCTFLSRGKSPVYSDTDRRYPVFAQKCNLKDGGISLEKAQFLDPTTLKRWPEIYHLRTGDVLVNSTGTGTVGRTRLFDDSCLGKYAFVVPDSHVSVIRTHVDIVSEYIYALMSSTWIQTYMEDNLAGSTNQKELYIGVLQNMDVPLPPINEQSRIAAKLIDLERIISVFEKSESALSVSITTAKSKILDLAIHGKLVPQDPKDEPASELLKRINPKAIITGDNPHYPSPFQIPQNWVWCLLKNICTKLVDGDHNPPTGSMMKTPYKMLSSKNINNNAIVDTDDCRFLSYEDWEMCNSRTKLAKGDVLLTTVASLGRSCVNETDMPFCFQRSVTVISTTISNYFLKFLFDSPYYQEVMNNSAKGTAQKGFYLNQVEHSLIPVPPMSEQFRIVAKINELFSELDFIEESLQA